MAPQTSTTQPLPWTQLQRWIIVFAIVAAAVGINVQGFAQDDETDEPPIVTAGVMPTISAGGNADSNNRMIAVTGLDVTGQSVLYLIDTDTEQLAVYQAAGGASSTRGVRLVGARNISLDLMLDGFNDKTEDQKGRALKYKDMERAFRDSGLLDQE